jgi:hypothetical protein
MREEKKYIKQLDRERERVDKELKKRKMICFIVKEPKKRR